MWQWIAVFRTILLKSLKSTHIRHLLFNFFTKTRLATQVWNLIFFPKLASTNLLTSVRITNLFSSIIALFLCVMGLTKWSMLNSWVMIEVAMLVMSLGSTQTIEFYKKLGQYFILFVKKHRSYFHLFPGSFISTVTNSFSVDGRWLSSLGSTSIWIESVSIWLRRMRVLIQQYFDVYWAPLIFSQSHGELGTSFFSGTLKP